MTALNFPNSPVAADTYTSAYIYDGEKWIIIGSRTVAAPVTYVTWDSLTKTAVNLTGSDLVATNTGTTSADQGAHVPFFSARTSGKWYFEIAWTTVINGGNIGMGLGSTASTYTSMGGSGSTGPILFKSGNIYFGGSNAGSYFSARTSGQLMSVAADLDNRKIWWRNSPSGDWNGSPSNSPATNVGGLTIPAGGMVPFVTFGGTSGVASNVFTANFGQSAFTGAVPSGFTSGWETASKSIDGSAKATFAFTNSGTVTLTTTQTNDVIVLVYYGATLSPNAARTVSTVTSSGLTWTKRSGNTYTHASGNTDRSSIEIWWAVAAAALTSHVITVTTSGNVDNGYLNVFGVRGCATPSAPWDTHASLATAFAAMDNNDPLSVSGVSTVSTTPFMIAGSGAPSLYPYLMNGFGQIQLSQDSTAAHYASLQSSWNLKVVAASSTAFSGAAGSPTHGVIVIDALA